MNSAIVRLEGTYVSRIEHHHDLNAQSLVHEVPNIDEAFDEFALIIGDAIHNLHTALDFAWWNTINRCMSDKISNQTKFPVRDSRQNLESALRGIEVEARCKALFDFLMTDVQPYKGGRNGLVSALHDLDISDKHLLVLELAPQGYIEGIVVRDQNGERHRGNTWTVQSPPPYFVDYERGIHVEDPGKLSVGITLAEAGIFRCVPIEDLLSDFFRYVSWIVERLETI